MDKTPPPAGAANKTPPPAGAAYLLLDVAGVPCALPRAAVSEVLPLPNLFRPPTLGPLLAGFLNLGGEPVPVVDLARLFGLRAEAREPGAYDHLVLAADRATAFLVDRASDLVTVAPEAVRPVSGRQTLNGCVEAEITLGDRLVHALAPGRILTVEEQERLSALTRAAQERLAALSAG
ncbi:chemotaxis protein CheW [Methylobacterium planeticum]|uniref:Chemotaxis protein CheW n=1 Tax=Methylobacterium planeticum TaxID=2615211 RepID=A0A6N6MN31_9HYPH|nr:chemotaxis protein CheW [Methylobacterium planeticum]